MKPAVTVLYGSLSQLATQKLPGWTLPFLVSIGQDLRRQASAQGVPLSVVANEGGILLSDTSPHGFAREFGTLESPPQPVLLSLTAGGS
jgi:hypothetical protein